MKKLILTGLLLSALSLTARAECVTWTPIVQGMQEIEVEVNGAKATRVLWLVLWKSDHKPRPKTRLKNEQSIPTRSKMEGSTCHLKKPKK